MTRAYTKEETAALLMAHVRHMIAYWEREETSSREKLEGLAFSIFSALDGSTITIPKFIVAPDPHPEDKPWHEGRGERWMTPQDPEVIKKIQGDLGGSLHDHFCYFMKNHLTPSSE